jgi:hypothetical protein
MSVLFVLLAALISFILIVNRVEKLVVRGQ